MKKIIKKCFATNVYTNAFLYKTLSQKRTHEMEYICREASQDDSIADISWLRSFRKNVAEGKRPFYTTDCNFSNSHIYGIWDSLFGNLGLDPVITPSIEHGLIFHNQVFNDIQDTARAACVTFGNFRKAIIRQYTGIPVFCVGPYIHYAEPSYDKEKLCAEHKKNGRTLLIFPMHSTDISVIKADIQNYILQLKEKQDEFDTVLINTFWWNLNDPLTQALEAEGYRIVSAGFRDDIMFLRRLKTLIQMSDSVMGDSIGTHVGYCIDCNVPFSFEPSGSSMTINAKKENRDLNFVNQQVEKIAAAFAHAQSITSEQRKLCAYYWGTEQVRTQEQIKIIADLSAEITQRSHGWSSRFPTTARNLLSELSGMEKELLKDALE